MGLSGEDKMNNVMVVGGAGFIGSHLCDALLAEGKKVVCVDNLMRGRKENISECFNSSSFTFIEEDAANIKKMTAIMSEHEIDFVFHLAANSDIQASAKDPGVEFESTLSTTWSLLYSMRTCGIKKFFFASTSAVYGDQSNIMLDEATTQLSPISYYGSAKMASEAFIHSFTHMNNMDACVFRFPNVIGPRLTHGVIFDFVNKLTATPDHLDVLGNGTQSKPYVHVYDLVKAIMLMYEKVSGMEVFNVGVNTDTSVSRIAEIVREEMNLPEAEIRYGTENIGWKGDVPHFQFNLEKIHGKGWKASMTSDEAVVETVKEVLACKQ